MYRSGCLCREAAAGKCALSCICRLFAGYACLFRRCIVEACCDNGDLRCIGNRIIIHSTEDDVCILSSQILYVTCSIVCIHKGDISGNVDDNVACTLDGGLKQRTGNSLLYSLERFVVALCLADTDVGDTLVGHNGLNICEVEVDECRQVDQVCDALYGLLQNLVCFL